MEKWEKSNKSFFYVFNRIISCGHYFHYDCIKNINDNYGHQEGDRSLVRIAQALEECTYFLKKYTVARYGGDEFIVAFIQRQQNDGRLIAYTITKTLEKINEEEKAKNPVRISIGIIGTNTKLPKNL